MAELDVRVLGALWVASDGEEVVVTGARRRALLVRLVIAANDIVSAGTLIDDLWGGSPSSGAASTLRSHIAALRDLLGRDRIAGRTGGYSLMLEDHESDRATFERDLREARSALAGGDLRRSAESFEAALGRWRGGALADVAGAAWAQGEIARLEELRGVGLEQWLQVRLELGDHQGVIADAERAVAEFPFGEGLWAALMLALYRAGRQGEALRVFTRLRKVLAEDLGIDPSNELRRLEQAILLQDPELDWRPSQEHIGVGKVPDLDARPVPSAEASSLLRLPTPTTRLVGRDVDLLEMESLSDDPFCRLITLVGPGGVGKTRLMIAHAARWAGSFADGAVFVALDQLTDAGQVRAEIVSTLARTPGGEDLNELNLANFLRTRELLLVLDNFEHVLPAADLLAELLGAAPGLKILVSSRTGLRLRGENRFEVAPLGTARPDGDAGTSAAAEMFLAGAQAVDRRFRPDQSTVGQVEEICRALDGLPLAIELAAAGMAVLRLEDILSQLVAPLSVGAGALRDLPDRHQSLEATIRWSYQLLSPMAQRALRFASVFQGPFTQEGLDAVCGRSMSDEIEALREASLVHRAEFGDRLRLLDLVRAFGRQLLDAEGETAAAQAAHRSYYATRYADVAADAHPSAPGPVARAMAADHADIRAGIASGVEAGDAHSAVTLTRALQPIWMTGFLEESGAIVDTVLGAFSLPADDELHLLRMVSYANSTRSSHRYWTERRITRAGELGQVGPQVAGLANMLSVAVSRRNMVEAQAVRKQLEPLIESPKLTRRTRAAGLCALVHCALGDGDLDAACRLADRAVEDAESEGALHMLAIARTARLQVVSTRDGVIDKGDLVAVVDGALSVGVPDMSYGALLCGARYVVEFDPAFAAELLAGAEQLATSALEGHLWPESELRDETLRVLGPHVADMLPDLAVAEPLDALTRLQAWLAHRPSDERAVLGRPHATDAPHSSRPAHQP